MKQTAEELLNALCQFTGTERYYRMLPKFIVTDGLKYLMEQAGCYWLAQLYGLHLVEVDTDENPFTVLKFRRLGAGARVCIEDGNGKLLARQVFDYTDLPFDEYNLYACWDGEKWVAMLPSEY